MINQFRKKPVMIEAVQVTGGNGTEITDWAATSKVRVVTVGERSRHELIEIETLEGTMRGNVGDWIIKGVNGEFYPCKPDIFEKTYDAI